MALKFRHCEDCACWRELTTGGHSTYKKGYGRCVRKSPHPCDAGESRCHKDPPGIRNADWPHTYKHEGCYESEKK